MHKGLEFSQKGLLEVIKSSPLLKAEPAFKLQWAVQLNFEYLQGQIPTLSEQPVHVLKYPHTRSFFCVHSEFPLLQPDCCLRSFPCTALRRAQLHPFCNPSQAVRSSNWIPTSPSPLQAEQTQIPQLLFACYVSGSLNILVTVCQTWSSMPMSFLYWGCQNWTEVSNRGDHSLLSASQLCCGQCSPYGISIAAALIFRAREQGVCREVVFVTLVSKNH